LFIGLINGASSTTQVYTASKKRRVRMTDTDASYSMKI